MTIENTQSRPARCATKPAPCMSRWTAALLAIAGLFAAPPSQAATTINVTTTDVTVAADGQCSLREALIAASTNANSNECLVGGGSPYIINLQAGATYNASTVGQSDATFGKSALAATGNTIEINGNGATITQSAQMRLIVVTSGSLTLRNLTLTGGALAAGAEPLSGWGSAALAAFPGTLLNLEDVTVANNAIASEAAVYATTGAQVNIHRSTIANNAAVPASPGQCQLRIDQASHMNIANSTLAGTQRVFCVSSGSTALAANITVDSSEAVTTDGAAVTVQNSILDSICSPSITGINNSSIFANCGPARNLPTLQPLANNGGATATIMPLQPNSSLNAAPGCTYLSTGPNPLFANGAAITTDQRGFARDAACDVGAVEAMALGPASLPAGVYNVAYSQTITQTGGAAPVTFTLSGTLQAGLTLSSGGVISGTPASAGVRTITVTATDANGFSSQIQYNITISKANQAITFGAQGGQTYSPGGTFAISPTATADSGLAVTYSSGSAGVCTVSGTTVTIVAAGTCTIRANQSGNASYNAAPQVTQLVTIAKANQTLTFNAQAAQSYSPGGTFALSPVAVSTSALAPVYSSTTPAVCTISGATVTTLSAGTCIIAANQAGNGNYNAAAQVTQSIAIAPAAQTIVFNALPNLPIGSAPFTVAATASSALAVSFASLTGAVCTSTGVNGSTITLLSIGTCTLRASQAGNANYTAAASVDRSFLVTQASTQFSLASSSNPVVYGAPVALTAQVLGANPGGTVTFSVNSATGFVTLCTAVPVSAGQAGCTVPGSFARTNPVLYLATYSGDTNNAAASASLQQQVRLDGATLSAAAYPAQTAAGRPVVLRAMVTARSFNSVSFYENGVALSGCANVAIALLPGSSDTGVASCAISAISAGSHNYVVTYPYAPGPGFEQTYLLNVVAQPTAPLDYTDMWWAGAAENGWGVSITQHGSTQFIVLYVYDAAGKPVWYVMPGGSWNGSNAYTGALYLPTSSPFNAYDAKSFKPNASVGTATITYQSASTATLAYTINGVTGSKNIQRQVFGADDGQPKLQVGDLWWGGSEQNGWGLNIAQQGRALFPVWYTYDAAGRDTWYAMPGGTWNGTTYSGDLYTVTSSPWLGTNYNPASFAPVKVGTMSLSFADQNTATMTYTVNGVTQSKAIVRQPY